MDIVQDLFHKLDPEFRRMWSRMDMNLRRSIVTSLQQNDSTTFRTDADAAPWKRPNPTIKSNAVSITARDILRANSATVTSGAVRHFCQYYGIGSDKDLFEFAAHTTDLINANDADDDSGGGSGGFRYAINAASSSSNQKRASAPAPPGSLEQIFSKSKKGDRIDMVSNADNKTVKSFTINMASLNSYVPSSDIEEDSDFQDYENPPLRVAFGAKFNQQVMFVENSRRDIPYPDEVPLTPSSKTM